MDFQEGQALEQLGQRGLGQLDSLVDTAQFLLDNATESEFASRREALVTAINTFYDERIAFINGLDLSDTDRENMLAVANIQRNIALEAIPQMHESVTERLKLEQDLQDEIQDLRDEQVENEADRQAKITELHEDESRRRETIEEDHQRRLEDIRNAASESALDRRIELERDIEDLLRESGVELSDEQQRRLTSGLQSGFGLDSLLDQLGINLDRDTRSRLGDISRDFGRESDDARRQRFFDEQNAVIRQQRAQSDLTRRTAEQETDINAQAEATATAIQNALELLLNPEEPSPTVQLERENVEKTSQNVENERQNIEQGSRNLQKEGETAVMYSDIATSLSGLTGIWGTLQEQEATLLETWGTLQQGEVVNIEAFGTATTLMETVIGQFSESLPDLKTGAMTLKEAATALDAFDTELVTAISGLTTTLSDLPTRLETVFRGAIALLPTPTISNAFVQGQQERLAVSRVVPIGIPEEDNRLFHFESTDRIARSISRQEALRKRREAPQYFPTRDQLRNARDVSREIASGISEAQKRSGANPDTQRPIEITIQPNDIVLNEQVIGRVMDEVLVRLNEDGRSVGNFGGGDT